MADAPSRPPAGGCLAGLTSGLLLLVVIAGAAILQYALRDPSLPVQALRRETTRLAARASPRSWARLRAATLEGSAPALVALDRRDWRNPHLEQLLERAVAIWPLVILRGLLVFLALPLIAMAFAWGLLEGLWARERIAAISGFPSAMGFALGKWLLAGGMLASVLFVIWPDALDPRDLSLLVCSSMAMGCYLIGRNLPLHF